MLKIRLKVRRISVCLLAGGILASAACTRMPVDSSLVKPDRVNTGRMKTVAQASIGTTTGYIDSVSGATVEITVLSEYFSAGGRKCRRFAESRRPSELSSAASANLSRSELLPGLSEAETNGLACEDSKSGWIEIPIQSIAG